MDGDPRATMNFIANKAGDAHLWGGGHRLGASTSEIDVRSPERRADVPRSASARAREKREAKVASQKNRPRYDATHSSSSGEEDVDDDDDMPMSTKTAEGLRALSKVGSSVYKAATKKTYGAANRPPERTRSAYLDNGGLTKRGGQGAAPSRRKRAGSEVIDLVDDDDDDDGGGSSEGGGAASGDLIDANLQSEWYALRGKADVAPSAAATRKRKSTNNKKSTHPEKSQGIILDTLYYNGCRPTSLRRNTRSKQLSFKKIQMCIGTELVNDATVVFKEDGISFEYTSKLLGLGKTSVIDYANISLFKVRAPDQNEVVSLIDDEATMTGGRLKKGFKTFFVLRTVKMTGCRNLSRTYNCSYEETDPRSVILVDLGSYADLSRVLEKFVFPEGEGDQQTSLGLLYGTIDAEEAARYLRVLDGDAADDWMSSSRASKAEAVEDQSTRRSARAAEADLRTAFIYPPESGAVGAVSMVNADRDRLYDGEFLNDNLINLYFKLQLDSAIDRPAVHSVHVFSTFFFSKMLEADTHGLSAEEAARAVYKKVRRWARAEDVFSKKMLFVPINHMLHWSLAVVCNPGAAPVVVEEEEGEEEEPPPPSPKKAPEMIDEDDDDEVIDLASDEKSGKSDDDAAAKAKAAPAARAPPRDDVPCILAMDSLGCHDPAWVSKYVRGFLRCAWTDRPDAPTVDGRFEPETMPYLSPAVPEQDNSYDCGVYVLKYFDLAFARFPLAVSPEMVANPDPTLGGVFSKGLFTCRDVKAHRDWFKAIFDERKSAHKKNYHDDVTVPAPEPPEAPDDDDDDAAIDAPLATYTF